MDDDLLEIQRRNFERQFGSLSELGFEDKTVRAGRTAGRKAESETSDSIEASEASEASEVSEASEDEASEEERHQPQVIKFSDPTREVAPLTKQERYFLKTGKQKVFNPIVKDGDDDNIHNDLELQRFLDESHILASYNSEASGADLTLETMTFGDSKKKILNSRLQSLSAVNGSTRKLEKMSMAMRTGMVKAEKHRKAKAIQDAKDNGIILSKEFGKVSDRLVSKKKVNKQKHKALKINSIGKDTKNGLVISRFDINRINNMGKKFKKKGKR